MVGSFPAWSSVLRPLIADLTPFLRDLHAVAWPGSDAYATRGRPLRGYTFPEAPRSAVRLRKGAWDLAESIPGPSGSGPLDLGTRRVSRGGCSDGRVGGSAVAAMSSLTTGFCFVVHPATPKSSPSPHATPQLGRRCRQGQKSPCAGTSNNRRRRELMVHTPRTRRDRTGVI